MRTPIALVAMLIIGPGCAAWQGVAEETGEAAVGGLEASAKTGTTVAALPIAAFGLVSAGLGTAVEAVGGLGRRVGEQTLEAGAAAVAFGAEPLTVDDRVVAEPMPAPDVPYEAQSEQ
jgi:hypothetical protein